MIVHLFTMLQRSHSSVKLLHDVGCFSTLVLKKVTVNWLSLFFIAKHNYCCFWVMVMMMMSKEQHVLISEILIMMEICCVIYIALLITQSYLLVGKKLFPDSGFGNWVQFCIKGTQTIDLLNNYLQ